jgi:hypothetical protein
MELVQPPGGRERLLEGAEDQDEEDPESAVETADRVGEHAGALGDGRGHPGMG